jgi:hypothetical protein
MEQYIYSPPVPAWLVTGNPSSFSSKILVRIYQSIWRHITWMFHRDALQSETQTGFPILVLKLRVLS